MKKLILIFFPFLFVSCSVKHKKTFDYIFNKTEAITLEQSKLTLSKDITVLSFSDSSMVDRNSSIIKVDSGWIVYSKNSESSILSFTSDGQFSGYIGHRGNGPGEYTSVYDVVVNQKSKVLEVLSDGGIFCYTFGGDFLDKKEVTYPAFSFAIDDRQNYWFYVGNNTTYGDAKMICTDENIANVAYYLHQKSNMLPMVENNFGRNGEWLTFHESLNHDLYTIENGKLDLSYAMDFPNYKLPKKLHELSGMEVIEELQRSNYASIINYLENHSYFNLSGAGDPYIGDHILTINADYYLPTDNTAIPYGPKEKVEGTPMDFRTPHEVGERINDNFEQLIFGKGYDHTYILNKEDNELSYCARCSSPKTGIVMETYTTQPGVQLYTGNWMTGNFFKCLFACKDRCIL